MNIKKLIKITSMLNFEKKISNKNLINKKKNNCVLFREDNKIIFKRYLKRMIKLHKIN